MLNKLIISFIAATQGKCSKRLIESIMNDFIYAVYLLIMLIDFAIFVGCGAWWTMLATAIMFMLLMAGWGTFSYHLRKTLLTLLYPPTDHADENGDSEVETLDRLNEILQGFAKELNVNLDDVLK